MPKATNFSWVNQLQNNLTIGEQLLNSVKSIGIDSIYGIPGDLIIKFFKLIENDPKLKLYTFSHEPAVGFAAIGAARATQKPAVACVTYGPGGLSLLNSVACAYAEKVPLIVIAGGMPMSVRGQDFSMHHTVKGFDTQLKVYREVTEEAVVLDNPDTAAAEIIKALAVCQETMLPVYIEVPADMVTVPIKPSQEPAQPRLFDEKELKEALNLIVSRFSSAKKPVLMMGVEALRFGLVNQIITLAETLGVPVVSTMLARDCMPNEAPNFYGVYLGSAGNPDADRLVADSDFVLMLGEDLTDVNFGLKLASLKANDIVRCCSGKVKAGAYVYRGVPLKKLVHELSEAQVQRQFALPEKTPTQTVKTSKGTSAPLATDDIIDTVNLFFGECGEMPVISDTGDCLFATLRLKASSIVGSSFYGTMGFAVPAAIGYALASKKRPLVLVGDGAFQMTGQEICHCPKYGINPIFIVNNNRSWGMEQLFHPSAINDLADWCYAKMAQLWGGKGYVCSTRQELWEALESAKDEQVFSLIEVHTGTELSEPLRTYVLGQRQ